MSFRILNLTSNHVYIQNELGRIVFRLLPANTPASAVATIQVVRLDGLADIAQVRYEGVEDLPEPREDTLLVVSMDVARAAEALGRSVGDLILLMEADRLNRKTSLGNVVVYTRFTLFSPMGQLAQI